MEDGKGALCTRSVSIVKKSPLRVKAGVEWVVVVTVAGAADEIENGLELKAGRIHNVPPEDENEDELEWALVVGVGLEAEATGEDDSTDVETDEVEVEVEGEGECDDSDVAEVESDDESGITARVVDSGCDDVWFDCC